MKDELPARLGADDRREQILAAASVVFGERGYAGGTTDAIAKQAGVSQAYVVRMFGGKENLFREVVNRAATRVQAVFRDEIAKFTGDETMEQKRYALGIAYAQLVEDRGILLALLHAFSMGHDETFGPIGRECFLAVYRIVREEAGMDAETAVQFFSQGMLMMVLFGMRMPDASEDPDANELMCCAFGEKVNDLIELSHLQPPIADGARS